MESHKLRKGANHIAERHKPVIPANRHTLSSDKADVRQFHNCVCVLCAFVYCIYMCVFVCI